MTLSEMSFIDLLAKRTSSSLSKMVQISTHSGTNCLQKKGKICPFLSLGLFYTTNCTNTLNYSNERIIMRLSKEFARLEIPLNRLSPDVVIRPCRGNVCFPFVEPFFVLLDPYWTASPDNNTRRLLWDLWQLELAISQHLRDASR